MRSHGFSFRVDVGCVWGGIDAALPQYGALGALPRNTCEIQRKICVFWQAEDNPFSFIS